MNKTRKKYNLFLIVVVFMVFIFLNNMPVILAEEGNNVNLFNGSFEDMDVDEGNIWTSEKRAVGWEPWKPTGNPEFYVDEETAYDGQYSVRIEAETIASRGSLGSQLIGIDPNKRYLVSVKIKTENVTNSRFRVNSHSEDGSQITGTGTNSSLVKGTTDWKTISLEYEPNENAKYIKLALFMETGTGKVWFDDVKVVSLTPITNINIENEKTIKLGEIFIINPDIEPIDANKDFSWSTSDMNIATVTNEGIVEGVGLGEATITVKSAYDTNIKADMKVIVENEMEERISVTGIELSKSNIQLKEKEFIKLGWIITPENASDQRLRFEVSNPNVVQMEEDGTVIAIKAGKTEIKIITEDGAYEAEASVEVIPYEKDEFDVLRDKWKDSILGKPYDLKDEKVQTLIGNNDKSTRTKWDSLKKEGGRTFLWDNLKSESNSEQIRTMYLNLFDMAKSYTMEGSEYCKNEELLSDIIDALDWLHKNRYYEGKEAYGNWWPWEIGIPKTLNDIVVLLYDELNPIQIKNYMDAIEFFQPNPKYSGENASGTTTSNKRESVGANRVDTCKVAAVQGTIIKDGKKIEQARDALSDTFEYVDVGDGLYRDGSFLQHTNIPYTGSYGNELIGGIGDLLSFLKDSQWEIKDKKVDNIYKSVLESFEPLLYKGAMMDMVNGRSIARPNGDHGKGRGIINSILKLLPSVPEEYALKYKSLIKYMIQEDDFEPFFEKSGNIELYNRARQIVEDTDIEARKSFVKNVQYPSMARVVHHRDGYAFGIASHSSRVGNYECMSNENLKGWYTGDGMTYLYNEDLGHYTDYWPTVDSYRMPGTTEDTGERIGGSGQRRFEGKDMSSKSWVGGVSLNQVYGNWGMDFESWDQTLNAKKSWFMFDDEIVALGAGISSEKEDVLVETTIDNRKVGSEKINRVAFGDSNKQSDLEFGTNNQINNTTWVHLKGDVEGADIGYYFPGSINNLHVFQETRQGSYSEIRTSGTKNNIENNYFTMYLDHGGKPQNGKYEYVLLPNKTIEETKEYVQNPQVEILANNEFVQAVKNNSLDIIAANFWTDTEQNVDIITSFNKASFMLQEKDGMLDIAISDPTMESKAEIIIELDKVDKTHYEVFYRNPRITIEQTESNIIIRFNPVGAQGETFSLKLKENNVQDHEESEIKEEEMNQEDLGDTTGTWIKDGKGWWYSKADKSYPENNWLKINGEWYHFNADGYMNTGWQFVGNKWYLLNDNGAMETGWQKVDNKWYLLNDNGDMATGWQKVDNKWYLLNDNGDMATGWQFVESKWYLLNADGDMATGWNLVNGKWYFLNTNGDMAADIRIDGYYVDKFGAWIENI